MGEYVDRIKYLILQNLFDFIFSQKNDGVFVGGNKYYYYNKNEIILFTCEPIDYVVKCINLHNIFSLISF